MATDNTKNHTDIKPESWVMRILPARLRPYGYLARLDRPIGWWLLLLPGLWAIALSSGGLLSFVGFDIYIFILFCIGAPVMRAAGCVVNDLWDRDLDKEVGRTALRPLAAGTISIRQALAFLFFLLGTGFLILMQMNMVTILLGVLSIPLIVTYPLMKRITWWPQAFLGITFNFGALMGWAAITGIVGLPAVFLYVAGFFWTLGYDTIYAYQDIEDDMRIGVKSSARWIGDNPKPYIAVFYALIFICLFAAQHYAGEPLWQKFFMIPAALHCIWQVKFWQPQDQQSSLEMFKSNKIAGLLILFSLLI